MKVSSKSYNCIGIDGNSSLCESDAIGFFLTNDSTKSGHTLNSISERDRPLQQQCRSNMTETLQFQSVQRQYKILFCEVKKRSGFFLRNLPNDKVKTAHVSVCSCCSLCALNFLWTLETSLRSARLNQICSSTSHQYQCLVCKLRNVQIKNSTESLGVLELLLPNPRHTT